MLYITKTNQPDILKRVISWGQNIPDIAQAAPGRKKSPPLFIQKTKSKRVCDAYTTVVCRTAAKKKIYFPHSALNRSLYQFPCTQRCRKHWIAELLSN